jgi:alginate O-acetyltransferase complex protein AlgI
MMQLGKLLGQGILAGDGIVSGFDRATRWSGGDVWCLAFGYGLQLFFDFAGYTHIAVGVAKTLGITVPENFERPFASANPSEFWTRWHMSLSFWIRDYVFFPLATLRREIWWRHVALVLSMVLFGLWHKATLLFLIWGGYQGLLLVAHRLWQQVTRRLGWQPAKIWNLIGWFVTAVVISVGWIFFRANSTAQAQEMLLSLASPETYGSHFLSSSLYLLVAVLSAGYGIALLISDVLNVDGSDTTRERSGVLSLMARSRWFWLPAVYALALLVLLMITLTQQGGVGLMMYRSF